MIKKITLVFAAIAFSIYSNAQSFSALYTFDSVKTTSGLTDPSFVPTATGITCGSFSATGTSANSTAAFRFSFTGWPTGATTANDLYTSLTGSINTAKYYEVTITPALNYTVNLDSIKFTVQRSGTGIRTYAVRSSIDGYATNLAASINPANTKLSVQTGDVFFWNLDATTSAQNGSKITLGGAAYTAISSPITFRFYGWNAEAGTGSFSIDNVSINGSASLPTTLTAGFIANAVCLGDSTSFTNTSSGPNTIISNVWNFGDASASSTTTNPSHLYAAPGRYAVTLTVTDNLTNTDTFTDSVTVYSLPVAGFSAPVIICGGVVNFTDLSSGSISTWMWNFGDPASGANNLSASQNPSHTFSGPGNFSVTETVINNNGCADTSTIAIYNDALTASLSSSINADSVTFAGNVTGGTPGYTFILDFGDGSTLNTTPNAIHGYPNGTYTACLTVADNNGCSDTSCTTFTILTIGIDKNNNSIDIHIAPNPSNDGVFSLTFDNNSTKTTVTVYNIVGKIILEKEINASGKQQLDLSNQANGSYFVTIKNDNSTITRKITINK